MKYVLALSFDKRMLGHLNSSGVVRAVNSQCAYLVTDAGYLIGIADKKIGNGPRLILTDRYDLLRTTLREKAFFASGQDCIDLPEWGRLDLSSASGWLPGHSTCLEPDWQARLELAKTMLNSTGNPSAQSLLGAPEAELAEAVLARDWVCATRALDSLVGLGPGLTPAGDDFLAGYFGTVHQMEPLYPTLPGELLSLQKLVVASLPGRTHPLSVAFTVDFIEGYTSDAFQDVLGSIACHSEERDIWAALNRMVSIGATTGTEMLRGILSGLDSIRLFLVEEGESRYEE